MLRLFRKYLKPYWAFCLGAIFFTLTQVFTEMMLPKLMSSIVDKGVALGDLHAVWIFGLQMLGWAALGTLCSIVGSLFSARASMGFGMLARKAMFRRVEEYSVYDFDQIGTSSLITRTTNDVQQVERVVHMLLSIVLMTPLMFFGAVAMALATNPRLSIVIFAAIPILILMVIIVMRVAIPYLRSLQQKIDQLNLVTRESLTGVQVIRAFNKQKWDDSRFDRANTDYCETNIKIGKMIAILMPLITLLISTVMISIYWVGANLLQSGALMVGDIMAVAQYATMILMSVMMLSMLFAVLPRAMAAAARINEVIEKEPSIIDGPDAEDAVASSLPGSSIVFENVTYTFKGAEKPTLESLNFTIEPGETAVIIGATGSGKTTILNLIMRFLEPTSGRVLIDGQDVSKVKQSSLREKISYVSQKALLFSGTIRDNILFGNQDASDEDVFRAAKYAVADEFIASKQDGYDYELTQSGSNLSGGQRQRMSIARALLKRSSIYMFDDSFSALDFSTDLKIRSALPKLIGDATMLVVAQRVNVAMGADKIIVLDDGRVVGIGTHEELMESCEVYNDIAMSQITEEDIERTNSNKPMASAEEVSSDER